MVVACFDDYLSWNDIAVMKSDDDDDACVGCRMVPSAIILSFGILSFESCADLVRGGWRC